jgi:hypothetical protein
MLVQSQKARIFQVGKRNIINQKIMDKWGNAKIALPLSFRRTSFQSISSLPHQLPFPNISALLINAHAVE